MELLISSGVLTLFLLVGAFVDFLISRFAPRVPVTHSWPNRLGVRHLTLSRLAVPKFRQIVDEFEIPERGPGKVRIKVLAYSSMGQTAPFVR